MGRDWPGCLVPPSCCVIGTLLSSACPTTNSPLGEYLQGILRPERALSLCCGGREAGLWEGGPRAVRSLSLRKKKPT